MPRMIEYGFTENVDFKVIKNERVQKERSFNNEDIPKLVWRELVPVCRNAGINQITLH